MLVKRGYAAIFILFIVMESFPLKSLGQIVWREWNRDSFAEAKQEDRIIIADIGMEGCTACRWQDEITYAHPDVIAMIATHFYPIQVDCQARPDIGEQYSDWSWPATIFFHPNGEQIAAIAGNRRPSNFLTILHDLVQKKEAGKLTSDAASPYTYPLIPESAELSEMRDVVRKQLDVFYDHENGGWGRRMKNMQRSGNFEQLMVRLRVENDSNMLQMLIQTLDGMLHQVDQLWGGMFVASVGNWESIVPEKRITTQSAALTGFAYGYRLTGDVRYLQAIRNIDRYVARFLTSPNGLFYTSQEDDPPGLPDTLSARDYYQLNTEAKRQTFGVPPVDHATYADLNARMISAYIKVFECTGESYFLRKALHGMDKLVEYGQTDEGWMKQFVKADSNFFSDKRIRKIPAEPLCFLSAQVFVGKALLDLYKVTQDHIYLDEAARIKKAMDIKLHDAKLGGYFASDTAMIATGIQKRKPIEINAVAGLFLHQFSVYIQDTAVSAQAEQVLLSVFDLDNIEREGPIVGFTSYALEMLVSGYVEYALVVRDKREYFAREMAMEILRVFEPRKIVHFVPPSRYPYKKRPTLYICNQNACSSPIVLKSEVVIESNRFVGIGSKSNQP